MKSRSYPFIAYFFLLPIIQVMVFDQFDLGAQLVPHVTLLFLIFYPTDADQTFYLLAAYLNGLYLDILHSTIGLQAAASVTVAFIRPFVIRSVFGKNHGICQYSLTTDTPACPICLLFKCGSDSSSSVLCLWSVKLDTMGLDCTTIYFWKSLHIVIFDCNYVFVAKK